MFYNIVGGLVLSIAIYFIIAFGLVFSQTARYSPPQTASLDFASSVREDLSALPDTQSFTARDGTPLSYRAYPSAPKTGLDLILVHGSGWHGMQFHRMAMALAEGGHANVIVPDLRGHGASPIRRGDLDYIGQFEDDLADLIGHLKSDAPEARFLLGGHSSGGGLVIRFAGGEHGNLVEGYLLLAPFLKYDAPTVRTNSGGWANPATRRIIGLSMLNMAGLTFLNDLPVISFSMPLSVMEGPLGKTATTVYSYRLNTSFAPRNDYRKDLRAIDKPMLLIAGADDEAFYANRFEEVISAETRTGQYLILPGVSHLSLMQDPRVVEAIADWLSVFAIGKG